MKLEALGHPGNIRPYPLLAKQVCQKVNINKPVLPAKLAKNKTRNIFPLVPMGVLAPGSAHARPSARPPINTSGNFPAHVSA
jgi:hypothetical protein